MGFGGTVKAMIDSLKENRRLLGKRKSVFDHLQENESKDTRPLNLKKGTKEEMEAFRAEWREKLAERNRKKVMMVFVSVLITCILIYGFFWFFSL
jgi:Sec-independent protein translocase protein TatA